MVSRRFPAYCLGRDPNLNFIAASYSADLANRNNLDVQRIIDSPKYKTLFPETRIPSKGRGGTRNTTGAKRTSDLFEVIEGSGSYRSAGVQGGINGMGFHFGMIDDPIKNRIEAESPTTREAVWDWYTSTFYTRMDDEDSVIVIIMTRWHEDDLVGRLLQQQKENPKADQWVRVTLPAIVTDDMVLNEFDPRNIGDALWPEKKSLEFLEKTRETLGSYDWESLFQQRPFPPGGAKIKIAGFKYTDKEDLPDGIRWAFFSDLAVSTKTDADFTVFGMVGQDMAGNIYIRDVTRLKEEWPDVKEIMKSYLIREFKPTGGGLAAVEKAGQQGGFIDDLNRDRDIKSIPLNIIAQPVDKDKLTRALPWVSQVEVGKVFLVNGPWVNNFLSECAIFTGAGDKHDDQIDFVSGGYQLIVSTYNNLTELMIENSQYLGGRA